MRFSLISLIFWFPNAYAHTQSIIMLNEIFFEKIRLSSCHRTCLLFMLVKTLFMLKPLEARRKKNLGDAKNKGAKEEKKLF